MKKHLQQLVDVGGATLGTVSPSPGFSFGHGARLMRELSELLHRKNGFYAFESALHVFPASSVCGGWSLSEWNSHELWRHEYGDLAGNKFFFAEDAFGNQFCLEGDRIFAFDAETGGCEFLCGSLEEWAGLVLGDYSFLTGYSLMHEWQSAHGALPASDRLLPKVPFCLGGGFTMDNVYASNAVSGMKSRGNLARQIRDLPDGAQIVLRVVD